MQYRRFGRLDAEVSALGFGCMRLPTLEGSSQVDEPEATRMLHYAIDHGVSYLDSGYVYHGGDSERLLGKALKGGYRQKVKLATKLPCGLVREYGDCDRLLNEQLERLQTDHIDCYLLHGLRRPRWELVRDLGVVRWLESARADGRIGYLGFSFHDSPELLKEVVEYFDGWDFCQIQYNYMDEENPTQAGTKGLRYAASKGLGVVVMEPLLGGRLATPPEQIQAIWDRASHRRTPAEWGLQWVWDHPEVSVVLSGMTTMPQVVENVASASRSGVNVLTGEELRLVAAARDRYNELRPTPCTQCGYCMPCPNGVDIPANLDSLNRGVMYGRMEEARLRYAHMEPDRRASACIECGECETKCPQSIPIRDWMPIVHQVMGEAADYDPRWPSTLGARSRPCSC